MRAQQNKVRRKIIKPWGRGQITIPEEFRRALGMDEDTLLSVTLTPEGTLEVAPVTVAEDWQGREYTVEEIREMLLADQLDAATANKVRRLLAS